MAAFSLLGKRAFFVTQSPGTIIRCFSCLSCPHRDDLTFVSDWGFLTTWKVLQPIFVSFLFGEGSYLAPNFEELERMVSDCFPSENRHLKVFL